MSSYDTTDEVTIQAPVDAVFKAVIDCYDGTNNWWVPYVSSRVIHGASSSEKDAICIVKLNEIVPVRFITKTVDVKENEMIHIVYPRGAFEGEGLWKFESIGDKTKISFRWQATPSGIVMKTIALFYSLDKKHSYVMQKGFKNLKKQLERR
jgi:hypothetical protein